MRLGWSLGPVFIFECIAVARRRQFYLLRALLVLALLAVLALIWAPAERVFRSQGDMAQIARGFLRGVVAVQLTGMLLAAPAATAGALCIDKSRGTLFHIFATDLNGREIVLGKLGARLAPVLALMLCGIPVLALSGLLGGIDFKTMFGAYVVIAGVALVGSSLALMLSVWAKKTHQALLPSYTLLGLWAVAFPRLIHPFRPAAGWSPLSYWIGVVTNPFMIALEPYDSPDEFGLADQVCFFAMTILVSMCFVAIAAHRIRPVVLGQASRPAKKHRPGLAARIVALVPGPSLDENPVLWREWHRKRPAHWTGRFWTGYAFVTGLASLVLVVTYFLDPLHGIHLIAAQINAWEIAVGLLLLSVSAASALSEERDRGSLDIIMATPLPTRSIVVAKWWGTFALVPRLMIFPVWVICAMGLMSGNWMGAIWMILLILAYASAIVSLGLALGTWVQHPGRAVVVGVFAYAVITVGWPLLITTAVNLFGVVGWLSDRDHRLLLGSPFYGVWETTEHTGRFSESSYGYYSGGWRYTWLQTDPSWPLAWIVLYLAAAALLFAMILLTFDRCLGRATRIRRGPSDPSENGTARDGSAWENAKPLASLEVAHERPR